MWHELRVPTAVIIYVLEISWSTHVALYSPFRPRRFVNPGLLFRVGGKTGKACGQARAGTSGRCRFRTGSQPWSGGRRATPDSGRSFQQGKCWKPETVTSGKG